MSKRGYTALHARSCESLVLSALIDECPDAYILFIQMIAGAGAWGRFPAHPKLLRRRVLGLSERMTAEIVGDALTELSRRNLVVIYPDGAGQEVVALRTHFEHNPHHGWHRLGPPEFPPAPDFDPPADLLKYLDKVRQGKFRGKTYGEECAKFGVMLEASVVADREVLAEAPAEVGWDAAEDAGAEPTRLKDPGSDLWQAILKATERWSPWQRDELLSLLLDATEDRATPLNEADVIEALGSAGPSVADREKPGNWLRRLLAQRGAAQRAEKDAGYLQPVKLSRDEQVRLATGQARRLLEQWPEEQVRSIMREEHSAETIELALAEAQKEPKADG